MYVPLPRWASNQLSPFVGSAPRDVALALKRNLQPDLFVRSDGMATCIPIRWVPPFIVDVLSAIRDLRRLTMRLVDEDAVRRVVLDGLTVDVARTFQRKPLALSRSTALESVRGVLSL